MSQEYANHDPLDIAKQAERDLNSHSAKWGHDASYDAMPAHHGTGASDSSALFLVPITTPLPSPMRSACFRQQE